MHHDSPHGRIEVAWNLDQQDGGRLDVEVPDGSTAEVALPDGGGDTLGPGSHHLSWTSG